MSEAASSPAGLQVCLCSHFFICRFFIHIFLKRFLLNIAIDDFNLKKIEIDQRGTLQFILTGSHKEGILVIFPLVARTTILTYCRQTQASLLKLS